MAENQNQLRVFGWESLELTDVEKARRLIMLKAFLLSRGPEFYRVGFSNYRTNLKDGQDAERRAVLDAAMKFAASLQKHVRNGRNVLFYGTAGAGKDHLATHSRALGSSGTHTASSGPTGPICSPRSGAPGRRVRTAKTRFNAC